MSARRPLRQPEFLPMYPQELAELGWETLDVLLISGDAYVDHPSFAMALLGRSLVAAGYRTGIVAQPPWKDVGKDEGRDEGADEDSALAAITRLGRPALFVGISAGAVDSMLAHYTAFRKKRSDDAYTPGGKAGSRPNRAALIYANLARRAFPGLPLVMGGIEASLRRVSHYDFWSDSLRRSIVLDGKADLVSCGMGEESIVLAARAAENAAMQAAHETGAPDTRALFRRHARSIPGTAGPLTPQETQERLANADSLILLPSHEAILADPYKLVEATLLLERQVHQGKQEALQTSGERGVLLTPPRPATMGAPSTEALDALYALPYARLPHPSYLEPIPAWEMIRTSITSHRGCGGGCAFCSLALHQGRRVASRSRESILAEARCIAAGPAKNGERGKAPAWAGSISDVGGPSANMWMASCTLSPETCARSSCLFPAICPGFSVDQTACAALLHEVAKQPGVRHVRVASGLRFDLALRDENALAAYTMDFTGGQLKIAPEHCADAVLRAMRKPSLPVFERFLDAFAALSRKAGKEQYVIPYLMSAHPGCTDDDMRELARWLKKRGWRPRQVQCFIPTPGTLATAMFYSGKDARGNPIPVARSDAERLRQHHILPLGGDENTERSATGRRHGTRPPKNNDWPARRTRPGTRKKS